MVVANPSPVKEKMTEKAAARRLRNKERMKKARLAGKKTVRWEYPSGLGEGPDKRVLKARAVAAEVIKKAVPMERKPLRPVPKKRKKRRRPTVQLTPLKPIPKRVKGRAGRSALQPIIPVKAGKTVACKGSKTWDPVSKECKYPDDKTRGSRPVRSRVDRRVLPKAPKEATPESIKRAKKRIRQREKGGGSCG